MYAEGDGVAEDDYEAYKIFEKIVREGSEPGSENAPTSQMRLSRLQAM